LWESPAQRAPVFDAKGIETVRRDGCPAASKMLEAALRLLFSTADLSLVKAYCCRQWAKILAQRVSLQVACGVCVCGGGGGGRV
jgi:DNA polymerase zeta